MMARVRVTHFLVVHPAFAAAKTFLAHQRVNKKTNSRNHNYPLGNHRAEK